MPTLSRGSLTRRICTDALFCTVAMMLSYLEVLIPMNLLIPLPGFKPGFANIITVAMFVLISKKDAAVVLALRVALVNLLFGSVTSLFFSATGALLSFLALLFAARFLRKCSYLGVSLLCAAAHNVGQLDAASCMFGAQVLLSYLPVLLVAAVISGMLTGILLNLSLPTLQRSIRP